MVPDLLNAADCAIICLCCVWCLKTRGARPWPWLSIVLMVAGIPLTLWALYRNYLAGHYGILLLPHRYFKTVSLPQFLSHAADKGCLLHVLTKLACVGMAALGPVSVLLYQLRRKKN